RARMLEKQGRPEAVSLANVFCLEARERIKVLFDNLFGPNDPAIYKLAMEVLRGEHAWLEQGIVSSVADFDKTKRRPGGGSAAIPSDSIPATAGAKS
ncbi:MAG: acyl-CoA dehydrogenase, partial [Gemmatimonadaceae bacterium]